MAQPHDPVQKPGKPDHPIVPEAENEQSRWLAAISQELHSPLNAILSLAEILDEGILGPQTEQQHHALRTMIETSEQLLALIHDAAIFSKFETGDYSPQTAVVWVMGLCQASIRLVRERSYHKEIRLDLQYDYQVDAMMADEWILRQILVNLLDTALQLTTEKGSVSLGIRGDLDQRLIVISIESSSGGIAEEDLPHLFEPFARLNDSQPQGFHGAGLKLALVQHMVRIHNGGITVQNQPGRGACFLVSLPWSRPARPVQPVKFP